jgi:Rrf2 family transcriptional regulator, iron-sulfur cluster assembly transcription factor
VAEVVTAVDESVDATRCGGLGDCQDGRRCLTHDLWTELSDQIYSFLNEITLGQLVDQGNARQAAGDAADVSVALKATQRVAVDPV